MYTLQLYSMCFGTGVSTVVKMALFSQSQHVKFLILHKWKEGWTAMQIHQTLRQWGDWMCFFTSHSPDVVGSVWVWWWVAHHTGWWVTSVTRPNINQVRQLIEKDPHLSIKRISTLFFISYGSAQHFMIISIWTKVCAQWIPPQLSYEQRRQRVTFAQEMIDIFERAGMGRLSDIVHGDEKWFKFLTMPNKRQNKHWMSANIRRHYVWKPG